MADFNPLGAFIAWCALMLTICAFACLGAWYQVHYHPEEYTTVIHDTITVRDTIYLPANYRQLDSVSSINRRLYMRLKDVQQAITGFDHIKKHRIY